MPRFSFSMLVLSLNRRTYCYPIGRRRIHRPEKSIFVFADVPAVDVSRTRKNISHSLLLIRGVNVQIVERKRLVRGDLEELSCKGLVLHELIEYQVGARQRTLIRILVPKLTRLAEIDRRLCQQAQKFGQAHKSPYHRVVRR